MKRRIVLFLMLGACWAGASNLVFNGSFEFGTDGFAVEKRLRPDTNPDLKFLPLKTVRNISGNGKHCLLFENPYAEYYDVFSKEFRLKPSTKYRLSVKVKSSVGGESMYFGVFNVDPHWSAHSHVFSIKPKWQDLTYTFTTAAKDGWYHILIRPGNRELAAEQRADFFFDDLRIEEVGDSSPDQAEAIAVTDKNLYYRGEKAKLTLKVTNPGSAVFAETLIVTGSDEYTGESRFTREIPVKLTAGETKVIPLDAQKLDRYAGIRVTVSGVNLKSADSFFVVIGKYEAKPLDILHDYAVALDGGLQFNSYPQKQPAYQVYNAPLEHQFELLSAIGCRILRDHCGGTRGVDWPAVEAERGKFDFSHLNRQLALYDKYNLVLFPVLGSGFIERMNPADRPTWPLWVNPLSERVKDDPPNCMSAARGHILLPPRDLYYNYIYQTVKHIKGRVPIYEIINEPNLYLAPDVYVRYLKVAHDAIRKADPASKICGFCLTSDFGAIAYSWTAKCVALGGLDYVDAVSFHPYASRELGSALPADQKIADLRKEMKNYGKPDIPLWNTELYYLIDEQYEKHATNDAYEECLCQPHHVVWRFLVDLGEGCVQSISLPTAFLWKRMLTPHMLASLDNYHELIPSENMVAYNTMARLFERAKNVKKIRYPSGIICYVYRKDGKLIAAVWNYLKKKGIYGDLSAFEVMDIFGNAEKPGEKQLGNAPFYLTPGKLSDTEFLAKLENLPLRLDRPVSAGEILRRVGNTLYVMLHNDSNQTQTGSAGLQGGGMTACEPVKFILPAHGSMSIEIPVKDVKPNGTSSELMLYLNRSTFYIPLKIVNNKLVESPFKFGNAEGTLAFGDGKITLTMTIRDTTDAGPSGKRAPWQTDCVELFFDTAPLDLPLHHAQAYTPETFRLFITPRDTEKLHSQGKIEIKECRLNLSQNKDGYSFTLVIPRKTGKMLGFDVKVDDANSSGVTETKLGAGKDLYLNRCNFSIVKEK